MQKNTKAFTLPTFGLEDLSRGLFNNKREDYGSMEALAASGVGDIFNDSSTSSEAYAMEAMGEYKEGVQIGQYVDYSLETIDHTVRIALSIKNQHGVEGFDPMAYAMEAVDIKGSFKKIWDAIITALSKYGRALANFFKSCLNFVGSLAFKQQSKYYKDNKAAIDKKVKDAEGKKYTIKAIEAKDDPVRVLNEIIKGIQDVSKEITTTMKEITDYVQKTASDPSSLGVSKDEKDKTAAGNQKKVSWKGMKTVGAAITAFASKLKIDVGGSETAESKINEFKKLSPTKIVNESLYGKDDPKKSAITIASFFTKVNPSILSEASANSMKALVDVGKLLAKSLDSQIKDVNKIINITQKMLNTSKDGKDSNKVISAIRKATYGSNTMRTLSGNLTGCVLAAYGAFIKQRSWAYTAAKIVVKGKGKEAADKDAKNKQKINK